MEAYKVCKEGIDAVEKALEQALGNAQIEDSAKWLSSLGRHPLLFVHRTRTMTSRSELLRHPDWEPSKALRSFAAPDPVSLH